jgi:amidase
MEASEDTFNAVLVLNVAGARRDARALDSGERAGGLLAGMPVLVKDNIETRDLPTTAGSLALARNDTGRDAPLVAQLREAGAVILGKTNLSEWANFRSEHSSSGWSGVGGQTRNAVDPARSPCGSSSGSGVAVARGYVPMAVGTETNGSIVCPASVNGVVGFKPTRGLVPGAGIVPIASTQDTAGPIADSVATAAKSLAVMSDRALPEAQPVRDGLRRFDALPTLRGLRIGVLEDSRGYDVRRDAELAAVLQTLRDDGAELVDGMHIPRYPEFGEDASAVLLYEFPRDLRGYFSTLQGPLATMDLAGLVAFNRAHSDLELGVFDQSIFLKALALEDSEADYAQRLARIRRAMRDDGLDRLFAEHRLDAIVGITASPAWLIDPVNGDARFGPGMSTPTAIAGNPHITLPLAQVGGLPVGVSLWGQRWRDHELAQIAYRLERRHPRPAYRWATSTPAETSASCSGFSASP